MNLDNDPLPRWVQFGAFEFVVDPNS